MEDPELIMSALSRALTRDGHTVQVEIYRIESSGWTLEVVDEFNNSTVWDGEFETDQEAFDEVERTIREEGIGAVIGAPSESIS